jgi:putative ABC transport system permease protein
VPDGIDLETDLAQQSPQAVMVVEDIGVILGVTIPIAVEHFAGVTTVVKIWSPALAFLISVITGIAFGIYPARRAAQMNPVEALRHQ